MTRTAVDTNVLLDVFTADATHGEPSKRALRHALTQGQLVVSSVVWAEVSAFFPSAGAAERALSLIGLQYQELSATSASAAGQAWAAYRKRGGKRDPIIADFLIGAHALREADCLLTRDRGFYRKYFVGLAVVDPSRTAPNQSPDPRQEP